MTGRDAEVRCDAARITLNKNAIPYDPQPPMIGSGIRVGTPAITTQGMTEGDMKEVASLIGRAVRDGDGSAAADVGAAVGALVGQTPRLPAAAARNAWLVREYLLTLVVAAAVTYLMTPVARRLALRWGAMTEVRDRDVHAIPTPRLGGVAMLAGLRGVAARGPAPAVPRADASRQGHDVAGAADRRRADLPARRRRRQVGARRPHQAGRPGAGRRRAGAAGRADALSAGRRARRGQRRLAGAFVLGPAEGTVLTVLIVVVTINAVNFVDGLDGLAAGIVAIAATSFFAFSYLLAIDDNLDRATTSGIIAASLMGICLGFLPHNFSPARIFMGDSGSMLLGLLLASTTITLTGTVDPNDVSGENIAPALVPLLLPVAVMLVPFVDMLLAIIRRTRAGRSPFAPDKQHLHHRLLEIGHSHARAVIVMYLLVGGHLLRRDGVRLPRHPDAARQPHGGHPGRPAADPEAPAAAPRRGLVHRAVAGAPLSRCAGASGDGRGSALVACVSFTTARSAPRQHLVFPPTPDPSANPNGRGRDDAPDRDAAATGAPTAAVPASRGRLRGPACCVIRFPDIFRRVSEARGSGSCPDPTVARSSMQPSPSER